MANETLQVRITKHVQRQVRQLASRHSSKQASKVVAIVGNGLTRLAKQAPSWRTWIKEVLETAGIEHSLEYLESLGYTLPAIFEYALEHVSETKLRPAENEIVKKIWTKLWDVSKTI